MIGDVRRTRVGDPPQQPPRVFTEAADGPVCWVVWAPGTESTGGHYIDRERWRERLDAAWQRVGGLNPRLGGIWRVTK